jgi:hypothetical protein
MQYKFAEKLATYTIVKDPADLAEKLHSKNIYFAHNTLCSARG